MIRFKHLVATCLATLMLCCAGNVEAQTGELDSTEAHSLEFVLLFSATKGLEYEIGSERFRVPLFADLAVDEERNTDTLQQIAALYAVEINYLWGGCFEILFEYDELDFLCKLLEPFEDWRHDWDEFVLAAAFLEEMSIRELQAAIEYTDEQKLIDTYSEMLGTASVHLLNFASLLSYDPLDYDAQLLGQGIVRSLLADAIAMNPEGFDINPGLNDAWYEPAKSGQGFYITVYPRTSTVFMGWFTYDMAFPGQGAVAQVGDPCQRWLTAQGTYSGSRADLVVYNSSGGLFDTALPTPGLEPIGSIDLRFENCQSGTVRYDLPGLGLSGAIPIQRLSPDNIAACKARTR